MSRKLVLQSEAHFNTRHTIPIDGDVEIGPDGSVEVSDEAADILLTVPGWVDPEAVDDEVDDETVNEIEETKNSGLESVDLDGLDELSAEDLLEIAKMANIKVSKALTKPESKKALVLYLKSKLKGRK